MQRGTDRHKRHKDEERPRGDTKRQRYKETERQRETLKDTERRGETQGYRQTQKEQQVITHRVKDVVEGHRDVCWLVA